MTVDPMVFLYGLVTGIFLGAWGYRRYLIVRAWWLKKTGFKKKRRKGPRRPLLRLAPAKKNVKQIGDLKLVVQADDSMYGYERDIFGPRLSAITIDDQGMSPRDKVLLRDGKNVKVVGDKIVSGKWLCPYTHKKMTDPSEIDIDHVVPLSEAWRSGAQTWTPQMCVEFGRSLTNLVAVSKEANREKGGKDINMWLPTFNTTLYIANWLKIKALFNLTMDQAEYDCVETLL